VYDENRSFESSGLQIVLRVVFQKSPIILFATQRDLRVAFYLKMTKKEQFLSEHNRLSPLNLRATADLLSRFKIEKASIFKDDNWSIEKLRRPFILWLTSLTSEEKEDIKKSQKI